MQNRTYVVIANYDSENRLIRYIGYSDKECTREAFYITTSGSVAYDTEITQGGLNYIELQFNSENTGPLHAYAESVTRVGNRGAWGSV